MDKSRPLIIAMKGHPGTGKSTLAHAIAATIRCPLLDKDDVRDCTGPIQHSLSLHSMGPTLLNDLSYAVLWKMAQTQINLGLNVVIDSPLSRRAHLDSLLQLAGPTKAHVIIIECRPHNQDEWRRRLEERGATDGGSSWHKPTTWLELQKLVEEYQGCNDYDVGHVPKLVVDPTGPAGTDELVSSVLQFVRSEVIEKWPPITSNHVLTRVCYYGPDFSKAQNI